MTRKLDHDLIIFHFSFQHWAISHNQGKMSFKAEMKVRVMRNQPCDG